MRSYKLPALLGVLAMAAVHIGCSKSSSSSAAASSASAKTTIASEVNAALVTSGLTQAQADAVTSNNKTTANVARFTALGTDAENDIDLIVIDLMGDYMDALDNAAVGLDTDAAKVAVVVTLVDAITDSMTTARMATLKAAGLDDDLIGDLAEVAVGNLDEAGIDADGGSLDDAMSEISGDIVAKLDDLGIPADQLAEAAQLVMKEGISGMADMNLPAASFDDFVGFYTAGGIAAIDGLTTIDSTSTEYADMFKFMADGAMQALPETGLTADQYAAMANSMTKSMVSALDEAGIAAADIKTYSAQISAGSVSAMDSIGLAADSQYMDDILRDMQGGCVAGLSGVANIDDTYYADAIKLMTQYASDYMDDGGFSPENIKAYIDDMTAGATGAMDELGLAPTDAAFANVLTGITGGFTAGLGSCGLSDAAIADAASYIQVGGTQGLSAAGLSEAQINGWKDELYNGVSIYMGGVLDDPTLATGYLAAVDSYADSYTYDYTMYQDAYPDTNPYSEVPGSTPDPSPSATPDPMTSPTPDPMPSPTP